MNGRPDTATQSTDQGALLVVYDAGCPVCRREIGLYQSLQPLAPLHFLPVDSPALPAHAPDPQQLLARLHARLPNGLWISGAAAFVALWARLPGWRWLARVARLPGITPALELAYRFFLTVRPLWRPAPPACPVERN